MRTSVCFLGLLLLHSPLSGYRADAQTTPLPAGSPTAQVASATEQAPSDLQKKSSGSQNEENSSSGQEHKLHLRLGTVSLGAGYSRISGPAYYPYDPFFYPGGWLFWGPDFPPHYFAYSSEKGQVKLAAEPKTAEVYLNHAYAGTEDQLRTIWLEPGAYDLSLRAAGRDVFNRRIYVLSSKSLKVAAKLGTSPKPDEIKDKP